MANPVSRSLSTVRRRYDRFAPFYRAVLPLFAVPPGAVRAAIEALACNACWWLVRPATYYVG